jgi:transcriptional regulator with XRE-family HTH domain
VDRKSSKHRIKVVKKSSKIRLKALGKRIRDLRKSRNWSQEFFAIQAGLDRSYMGGIERGERNITFDTMCVIAKTLNIDLSELLEDI